MKRRMVYLAILLLTVSSIIPARKHHRKYVQDNGHHYSDMRDYKDYEHVNNANYDYNYDYDLHQMDQEEHHPPQHDNQHLPQRNKLILIVLDG